MNIQNLIITMFLIPALLIGAPFIVNSNESTSNTMTSKKHIKIALLLDTSNSMDGLIDQAKAQLWQIVNELALAKTDGAKPDLAIALYEYGNDRLPGKEGYIRQVLAFSNDLDLISEKLFSLKTNGGNEYCGQVIKTSLNQLDWGNSQGDLKMIFIAGNEGFDQGPVKYQSATTNAREKDVIINTIFCGDFQNGIGAYWKNGADLGQGEYMAIDQNQKSVYIASPFDPAILKLNEKLNLTYIPYGRLGTSKIQNQSIQDSNASNYGSSNAVQRAVSKSSHLYQNFSWDLVDAVKQKDFELKKVDQTSLPKELQGKTVNEIKAYIEIKQKERALTQQEIQNLNTKRNAYVAEQKKLSSEINGLEDAMLGAIKKQAIRKHFRWDN